MEKENQREPKLKKSIVILGDCTEVMKSKIPDNSVDCVVTDPPYFLTNKSGSGFMGLTWDSTYDIIKLLWLNREFVEFAKKFFIEVPQDLNGEEQFIAQEIANIKESNKIKEKKESVQFVKSLLKLQNLLQKDFAQGIVITGQEVSDLLNEWCGKLIKKDQFLNGNVSNAWFVIPLLLLEKEARNSVHVDVLKRTKVSKCEERKIWLTLMDALKINEVIEGIIGNKLESLSTQETTILANYAKNIANEKKFSVIISENIKKHRIMPILTLLLCALFATKKQKKIQNLLIENFNYQWAKECLRVLKPGGYLLAFGGSRTYHRMACAIEDAGFEIRDQIMWVYGSGFPKSLDISKAIEKQKGVRPLGKKPAYGAIASRELIDKRGWNNINSALIMPKTQTEEAREWGGWGTALKPAHEPIVLARKPLSEKTVAENVLKWEVGGLNIGGCRIEAQDSQLKEKYDSIQNAGARNNNIYGQDTRDRRGAEPNSLGRFPANVILECICDETKEGKQKISISVKQTKGKEGMFGLGSRSPKMIDGKSVIHINPKCPCYMLDEQSGISKASRFFYCAKASKRERNIGCENMEKEIGHNRFDKCKNCGGYILQNPDRKSACKCENPKREHNKVKGNFHPTVKPLALMKYLIKLVSREGQIVLDPFIGSGSTCVAAKILKRKYIGIDNDPEYVNITNARLKATEKK